MGNTLFSQDNKLIKGSVTDFRTNERIPFAVISLKHQLIGTNTNEEGEFVFYYPKDLINDSVIITCLGYKSKAYALGSIQTPLNVKLEAFSYELAEVVVRPLLPTDYIKMAMKNVKQNYPQQPFTSQAYYREQLNENETLIKQTEAVFKTYYPNYQDTIKNQHQLLLYRKADDKQIAFMREEAEKRKDKKVRKAKKKGKDTSEMESEDALKVGFGGPETVIGLDFIKDKEAFLDSLQFKKFNYSFGGSSSYQDKELMIINFEARKQIDHVKPKGKIYLDVQSLAITSIEYNAEFEIPLLYKPVLFLYGISIDDAVFTKKLQYHEVNGTWYPKDFQWIGKGSITKRHMFSANDRSEFLIEQLFFINKMQTSNNKPIPEATRFKADKKIEEQVHNDSGVTWSEMNQVQRTVK